MLEILLVVVIIGIASAVAVPSFARSFRGAKLRNSTRAVLGMHRNAQAKAVLGQRYMAVLFDARKGTMELVDQGQPGDRKDAFFSDLNGGAEPAAESAAGEGGEAAAATAVLARKLEDGVKFVSFRGGQEIDEIHFVSYYPNGMCEAYDVTIGDDENRTAQIHVDAVTGKAKVERE